MAYQMDFFAADTESKVLSAISDGKVQYPAYVFIRSNDGSETGRLAFVDQNNVLKYICCGNESGGGSEGGYEKQIINVDELPSVSDGKMDVLYIVGDYVYLFNGTEYKMLGKDNTAELNALTKRVSDLEMSYAGINEKVSNLETEVSSINDQIGVIKESNADLIEQLETVTEEVTKFEDRIVEVEKATLTFVELE